MTRIAFMPDRVGWVRNYVDTYLAGPVPPPPKRDSGAFQMAVTDNSGNLAHHEALARLLKYEHSRSCYLDTPMGLDERGRAELAEMIDSEFDAVCLSLSNVLRPLGAPVEAWYENLADILSRTRTVRLAVLGIGVQEIPNPDLLSPDKGIGRLLTVFADKGGLIGTRGDRSTLFLHRCGLNSAQSLGCPSLFVFPEHTLRAYERFREMPLDETTRVITAGRFAGGTRFSSMMRALEGLRSNYVFQSELSLFFAAVAGGERPLDLATGRIEDALWPLHPLYPKYKDQIIGLYYFSSSDAWRQFSHHHDIFAGDRFHCAVMALQVGRPAIVFSKDARVEELTSFFRLPRIDISPDLDAAGASTLRACRQNFDTEAYVANYRRRHADFVAALARFELDVLGACPPVSSS